MFSRGSCANIRARCFERISRGNVAGTQHSRGVLRGMCLAMRVGHPFVLCIAGLNARGDKVRKTDSLRVTIIKKEHHRMLF